MVKKKTSGAVTAFDVIVVGGGHAGCESALAAARMGCRTLMITLDLEKVALMPCNPAVGGVGKGQLTREIDALGGEQGRNTDRSYIQMKMLNTGKGPAVRALRAQTDKKLYEDNMKRAIAAEPDLMVLAGAVAALDVSRETIKGIRLTDGSHIAAGSVVLACGTFLQGMIVVGELRFPAGRMGEPPATDLSHSLREQGLELGRFQSATPPRIDSRSINTAEMTEDPGDPDPAFFSLRSQPDNRQQIPCFLTYTTAETHEVVRKYLHLSPIKTGSVSGKGPRYCPSIDRKVMNFPDRDRHPVFVEPEGRHTRELYLQGLTTSLPVWVQEKVIQATPGLRQARLMRPGYAVEYDYVIPSQLGLSLETKAVKGLFLAGQINGTSGYEEAAAQGLMAGINAALRIRGEKPLILRRDEAYIGVLIDDLVTKGVDEPYRMFTSRAEFRLILRHDNAYERLAPVGHRLRLVPDSFYQNIEQIRQKVETRLTGLAKTTVQPGELVNQMLKRAGSSSLTEPQSALQLLKRPELSINDISQLLKGSKAEAEESKGTAAKAEGQEADRFAANAGEDWRRPQQSFINQRVEIEAKYEGYIARQMQEVSRRRHLEETAIPPAFEYAGLAGITIEAREKLTRIRPASLGQASRIAGVSPADISVLAIYLKGR